MWQGLDSWVVKKSCSPFMKCRTFDRLDALNAQLSLFDFMVAKAEISNNTKGYGTILTRRSNLLGIGHDESRRSNRPKVMAAFSEGPDQHWLRHQRRVLDHHGRLSWSTQAMHSNGSAEKWSE